MSATLIIAIVVVWIAIAAVIAVVLGRAIRNADRHAGHRDEERPPAERTHRTRR